jgi:hypothetical protein
VQGRQGQRRILRQAQTAADGQKAKDPEPEQSCDAGADQDPDLGLLLQRRVLEARSVTNSAMVKPIPATAPIPHS